MTAERAPVEAGRFWKWLPVVLLGTGLSGLGFMLRLALDDPGFAVEKDYYKKAVAWDQRASEEAANRRLGWRALVELEPSSGGAVLRIKLRDAADSPLEGASLQAELFANARSLERSILALHETTPGTYVARLESARPGLWEVRLQAERGGAHFGEVARTELLLARAAVP